jgi:hypothetical protein
MAALALTASGLCAGCATTPPRIIDRCQLAPLPWPEEPVYQLKPGDPPDKVMKAASATIKNLEAAVKARDERDRAVSEEAE